MTLSDVVTEIRNGIDLEQYDRPTRTATWPISRIETISAGKIDFDRVKYVAPTPPQIKRYELRSGDILFSHINSPEHIGKTALFTGQKPLLHGINLLLLRVDEAKCVPGYLAALLKSSAVRSHFRARCKKAVNQASLNQDDILSLKIRLPSLTEQKRVAEQLEQADRVRRTRRYALELTDTFLPAAFLELFGDYLTSERSGTLADVLAQPLNNGVFEKNSVYGDGVPVIWVDNLYHTISIYLENLRRARVSAAQIKKYRVLEGDLLFTRSSLVRDGIGQINIVPALPEPTLFECHVIRARIDRKAVNPFYLLGLYRSPFGKAQILRRANTATMTTISQEALEELPCPLPPLPLQQKFAALVERVERLRAVQRESLRQADHLFASLLHHAFAPEQD